MSHSRYVVTITRQFGLEFPQSYPQGTKSVALNIHNFQKMPQI